MTDDKPTRRRFRIRSVISIIIAVLLALALLWIFGPREPVDLSVRFDPASLGDDLDTYLAQSEARYDDIRPSAAKEIVWAYPASHAKTPIALVYLHGFSAAKGEIRPVPDEVAAQLGANLYYTRLTGHGRDGDAMAEATINDWVQDAAEAVAIGDRIGEKVVVMATSTGGTLAVLSASLPEMQDRLAGLVLISPNFSIRSNGANLLTWPFAETIARMAIGKQRGFEPMNEMHRENWTTRYPSKSLMPMASLVNRAAGLPFEIMRIPALFIYHPDDQVVDHTATAEIAARWGGPVNVIEMPNSDDPSNHVIAGDIVSPSNNDTVAKAISEFIADL